MSVNQDPQSNLNSTETNDNLYLSQNLTIAEEDVNPNESQLSFDKNGCKVKQEMSSKIKDMIKHLRNETIKLFIKAFTTKKIWIKLYLFLLLLFCTSLSVYVLITLILGYLEFAVVTTTRSITETTSVFPKVTICNYNTFQTEYALEFLKEINKKIYPNIDIFDLNQIKNLKAYEIYGMAYRIISEAKRIIDLYFTDTEKKRLAHGPSDLIFDYRFRNANNFENDFVWYFDQENGNCYVFNSGFNASGDKVKFKNVERPGLSGALHLSFYVNSHENLTLFNSFTGSGSGAMIRIENNSYLSNGSFENDWIRLMPGSLTMIKIRRSFVFSLEKPYSNCDISNENQHKFIESNEIYRLFANSPYQYTRQACFVQCWQQNIIRNCSCQSQSVWTLFENVSLCLNIDQLMCQYAVTNKWNWNACLDLCPLECNQTNYETDISFGQLLGDKYLYYIQENVNLTSDFVTQKIDSNLALKSFVNLDIFYDTLAYDVTVEKEKMNLVDLLASIGGNLGLFMGVSIFTLFEIVEILIEIHFIKKDIDV